MPNVYTPIDKTSLRVTFYASEFRLAYFLRDKNIFLKPHHYQFSGRLEIKVPSEVAVRQFYLELFWQDAKEKARLLDDLSGALVEGYVLRPSSPLWKRITFLFECDKYIETPPESATIIIETTGWKRHKTITLVKKEHQDA